MKILKIDVKCSGAVKQVQKSDDGGFLLKISSEKETVIERATVTFSYIFGKDDKLFLNGYQSWTFSREIPIDFKDGTMKYCPKFIDKKFGFSMYGDRCFYKSRHIKGVNHGYTYAYIRQGSHYALFGSLAERTGYTRIIFNTAQNTVTLEKDCAGRAFVGEYTLFDMIIAQGDENAVFDEWFSRLKITPIATEKKDGVHKLVQLLSEYQRKNNFKRP